MTPSVHKSYLKPHLSRPADESGRRGVTLMELLIVLAILSILAVYLAPRIMDKPEQARRTKAALQMEAVEGALKLYQLDNGRYPTTEQGLQALVQAPTEDPLPRNWRTGGYLEKGQVPKDPWGYDYKYICPGVHNPDFDLWSTGPDGEDGGEGDNADVSNWTKPAE